MAVVVVLIDWIVTLNCNLTPLVPLSIGGGDSLFGGIVGYVMTIPPILFSLLELA